ncbi:TetR/AcrR family transcriptional regulator [Actinoalloteichus sp. AHMU CJ021]|uniref:Transcriptional regulator, TetR family n=1 Tax=Actinoalloteichus caeruleus DSM 43889 TaxID=1120930 RepID=A0ABT1JM33_ACTCY|nr:TetR/AcrR family transcriptional regulator [Actinoalloteichus caeruleus]AUS79312.1 TetR/AcrR family transcriptional regulator [Actinoalloteichus sp. AHMU CJ021]MCP2333590.1 transcriptional regulator, TetR family [Actinoalloteichus caeruleus DSM 43889]
MGDQVDREGTARTRRRGAALVAAIHAAALAELAEVGLGRMSMEGVARRAGAAKTSLYRRWNSPHELLLDAIQVTYPQEEVSPATNDLRGDLIRALRQLREWMNTDQAQAVSAIMIERDRYPDLVAALFDRVFDPAGGRVTRVVLRHYADRGAIDAERLTPVVTDIGEALVFKFASDTGRFPTDEQLADIVDQAILPAVGITSGWSGEETRPPHASETGPR